MISDEMEHLIVKYLSGATSTDELDKLNHWLKDPSPEAKELWDALVRTNYAISTHMEHYNSKKSKQALLNRIREDKKTAKRLHRLKLFKVAAMVLVLLSLGILAKQQWFSKPSAPESIQEGQIVLRMGDGSIKVLDKKGAMVLTNRSGSTIGTQQGEKLQYNKKTDRDKITLNTLSIPFGKQFEVELSDGTVIHLNSGSTLTYPTSFELGGTREVFLDGEAYFEVAKNKASPFIVNSSGMNIRVLGTTFVVSSYKDDAQVNTVLVEGSVGLYHGDEQFDPVSSTLLKPGDMATWARNQRTIAIEKVDTQIYTDWIYGKMVFNHMPFQEILKKLERHYNVSITNKNRALDAEVFTASFDTESIEEVLTAFTKNYPFSFKRLNDQIIID